MATTINAAVGWRVRCRREQLGLTQRDLGAKLQRPVSHVAVGDIERGKTRITLDLLARLADALDCGPGMFLGGGQVDLPATTTATHRCPNCGHHLSITLAVSD